jgi:putative PEP-CTERM system histidine kinase
MASMPAVNLLLWANLLLLGGLSTYLLTKINRHRSVPFLIGSLLPLIIFEAGSYFFLQFPTSRRGAQLIMLGLALVPLGFSAISHTLGRSSGKKYALTWTVNYACQILILALFVKQIFTGQLVEWVTGILDQPVILIDKRNALLFVNVLVSGGAALLCFDATLRKVENSQLEALKVIFIAFLGLIVYFSYVSVDILLSSYVSQSLLFAGAAVIFLGLSLLAYSFARYPFWEIKISVSRRIVFGCLSGSALIIYLAISGTVLDILRVVQPYRLDMLLPFTGFFLVAALLATYLSPSVKTAATGFITRNFFRNKYDYRDLWMKFSQRSSGSLNLTDVLPKVSELIAEAMFVRQVAVWLRSPNSESFALAHCFDRASVDRIGSFTLRLNHHPNAQNLSAIYQVPQQDTTESADDFVFDNLQALKRLGIARLVTVTNGSDILALFGVGEELGGKEPSPEDDRLLSSIGNQIGHLIVNNKLSEELLLSREWESFNRFASFVVHDLKNLATLQGMTLENGKRFSNNPEFIADAFATFHQTTEKMINLIASLSVQRGQFSLKQQPVNILEVIASTFDDLKLDQRNGLKIVTAFPPKEKTPIISGDRDLLQKAFTNLLLNAIQSLPKGEGAVEVTVSEPHQGRITAAIKDTGCGIPAEQLKSLFRPFQTTKKQGTGIGLCHTRSIIEVHGGQIRIESQVNAGTKVEVELPTVLTTGERNHPQ